MPTDASLKLTFSHLKIGRGPIGKDKSSNHPFFRGVLVSFREGSWNHIIKKKISQIHPGSSAKKLLHFVWPQTSEGKLNMKCPSSSWFEVTFLFPNVGGHQPPLKGSREITIPKRSRSQNCQDCCLLMYISRFFLNMISRSSAVQGQPWTPRDLSCSLARPNVPRKMGNPYMSPISRGYLRVSYPQESLENTINTMGTRTLGVHPIVPWET